MPIARKKNHPILGKALAFLALPLTPMAKAKGPITKKLLVFKKARAMAKARAARYKLFRHYNYAYIGEYQFSPSSSPLIRCPASAAPSWRKKRKIGSAGRFALASLLICGRDRDVSVVDALPSAGDGMEQEACFEEWEEETDDGDASVDGRAERFIEKFYEEIRLQRQQSLLQA